MVDEFERQLIRKAISRIEYCIHHDMDTALILIALCKYIAGDDFDVTLTRKEGNKNGN